MLGYIPFNGHCSNCNTNGDAREIDLGEQVQCPGCGKSFTIGAGSDTDLEESLHQLLKAYWNSSSESPKRGEFAKAEAIAERIASLFDHCINRVERKTLEDISTLGSVAAEEVSGRYDDDQWFSSPAGIYDPESLRSRATHELQRRGLNYHRFRWMTKEQFEEVAAEEAKRAAFEKAIGVGTKMGLLELGIVVVASILFAAIFSGMVLVILRWVG
jgi:hypothetical protein